MIFPKIFASFQNTKNPEIFAGFAGASFSHSHIQNFSGENSLENIIIFCKEQNIFPEKILNPHQTHGKIIFDENNFFQLSECDGVYTQQKNILCMVKTADCLGAIFYHPQKKLGATLHAGWRGLEKKIFSEFLKKFPKKERKDFLVAFSPSLGKCCAEFSSPYQETPHFFHPFIHQEKFSGKFFVDLWQIAKQELLENGILEKNIEMPLFCTKCQKNSSGKFFDMKFWSHRNGEKERNGTFFMKK